MRIFSASFAAWSISRTLLPRAPAVAALIMPAAPAPITITSNCIRKPSFYRDGRVYPHEGSGEAPALRRDVRGAEAFDRSFVENRSTASAESWRLQ
jgi:hypothetical protein